MKKKNPNNNYFTQETENYIVQYNNEENVDIKNKIFTDHIYYPLYKLAENIIHRYKFYYTDEDNLEDLKHEIITVLIEDKLHRFDPSKGSKAYSYLGTIVKRWLIHYNEKNFKNIKRNDDISGYDFESTSNIEIDDDPKITLSEIFDIFIELMYLEIDILFQSESDRRAADALLTIFKSRKSIDVFKKKAILIYIKEMTGLPSIHANNAITVFKDKFYELYKYYNSLGFEIVNFED